MYFTRKQKRKQNVIKVHCDVIYFSTSHTIFSQDRVRKHFFYMLYTCTLHYADIKNLLYFHI